MNPLGRHKWPLRCLVWGRRERRGGIGESQTTVLRGAADGYLSRWQRVGADQREALLRLNLHGLGFSFIERFWLWLCPLYSVMMAGAAWEAPPWTRTECSRQPSGCCRLGWSVAVPLASRPDVWISIWIFRGAVSSPARFAGFSARPTTRTN